MTTRPSIALQPASRPTPSRGPSWAVPAALILLSLIPVIAGASRMTELVGGAAITPQNARFVASPIPVVVHIVSVTIYSLLGAFQFLPALRGRRGWHRIAGGILIPAGLFAALVVFAVVYATAARFILRDEYGYVMRAFTRRRAAT